ncbi:MAG: mechanosensitive ion channel [Gammaproteobacteria bacterium]|nr:mechanosensitive ion channel [Gammaproteobacteria bacterium]
MKLRYLQIFLLLAPALLSAATDKEIDADMATTNANANIPIDDLELMLRPLSRTELEIETLGWLKLLKEKITEISEAEIGAKHKRLELKYADDLQAALEDIEKAKEKSEASPDDPAAAEALDAAISRSKTLKIEADAAARESAQDASVEQVIEAAKKYAQEQAADSEDEDSTAVKVPEADNKPLAEQDETDRKLVQAKQAVSRDAAERAETRKQLLDYINHLREQQTILIDRTNVVIDAWELKGGDATEERQYIKAVSGIQVDVTDAEATWNTLVGWTLSEEGGQRWLKNISVFIITIIAFLFLSRLAERGTRKLFAKATNTSQLLEDFTLVSVRRLVIAVGVLVALTTLEINVGPLLAVIGAAGFVVAFALQDSLGNFASGILILLFRPFDVGDMVQIGGVVGKVRSVNLLSVQINTPDNQMVIVPNNSVWGSSITNITGSDTRRVDLIFGISYDDDIDKAQHIMEELVSNHELVLKEPEPVIRVNELANSSVNFICRPWVKTGDYWTVYWDLTRAVKQRFDKEGISIPYPQQDVHFYNVAASAPPMASLPDVRPGSSRRVPEPAPADSGEDLEHS